MESLKKSIIIDCHETLRVSRNDAVADFLSLRESVANEAIYNLINQKIFNGEILNYGLPRFR